jgi:hypothetical protein
MRREIDIGISELLDGCFVLIEEDTDIITADVGITRRVKR